MITQLNTISLGTKQQTLNPKQRIISNQLQDTFIKNKINFKGYHNDASHARYIKTLLGMSETGVEREILGKEKSIFEIFETVVESGSIFGRSKRKQADLRPIQEDMNIARREKIDLQEKLKVLKIKKSETEVHIGDAKDKIYQNFSRFLQIEKQTGAFPPDRGNAIMIEGPAKSTANEIIEWVLKTPEVFTEEVTYNHSRPTESLSAIRQKAEEAKRDFSINNKRTIIHVKNLGDLLSDQSDGNIDNIGKYNRMLDNFSEKYKATLLFHIEDADKVESASIATHRAFPKVPAKIELSDTDKSNMRNYQTKLDEFDRLAKEGKESQELTRNWDDSESYFNSHIPD